MAKAPLNTRIICCIAPGRAAQQQEKVQHQVAELLKEPLFVPVAQELVTVAA